MFSGSVPFVYTTERSPEFGLLVPPTLRGREASAYLSYVIEFYDHLPEYSIFVHAFPEQWHNDLFGPYTLNTLRNIRLQSVDAYGYVNLRCQHNPGCPTSVYPLSPSQADIENHDIRAYFSDAYQQIFNVTSDKVPGAIGNVCCGHCPRFEQCRCDVYGWCGPLPSGESLQAVIKPDPHDGSPT
ncbi:hypothetical protein PENSUB_8545 [Penicillium subrubescens]|uniref:Uncharacterized protein n=1 Tax=Penicillium subrubescens TaxID=1316194 RepID=A0A1Q5TG05_9EURO|nr:hypothetical protein PENSUB_8545 [Penicillium subrubescens]